MTAWRAVLGSSLVVSSLLAAGCGTSTPAATPPSTVTVPATLFTAPEPAVSPPAGAHLPGRVVAFAGAPEGVAVTASGLVAVSVRSPDGIVLLPIGAPDDRRFVATAGSARHLGLGPSDRSLLVPDESDNTLVRLALPSGRTEATVPVGHHPHDAVAVGPGTTFVADELGNAVSIVAGDRVVRTVPAPLQPGGMAADATGTHAVVVGVRGRQISEYTSTGTLVGSAACGAGPTHAVTGDGGLFWVADTLGGDVIGYRLGAHGPVRVATIPVGPRPYGLAFDARRDTLWVTVTGTDRLVGLHLHGSSVASTTTWATVRQPNTVAVDPTTGELVVTGSTVPGALQLLPGRT